MLNDDLLNRLKEIESEISSKLNEFKLVSESEYFYELCFCCLTPQSKAENAIKVIEILKTKNFFDYPFNPSELLRNKEHYIRFHNIKAENLLKMKYQFPAIQRVIGSNLNNIEKRNWLADNVKGIGMKEASHFLRNIGYENLAILDRHILRNLVNTGLFDEIPNISTQNRYLAIEEKFREFAEVSGIKMDVLDLLFWSNQTGKILK
jgi:N-glycosylase/DNA lyase